MATTWQQAELNEAVVVTDRGLAFLSAMIEARCWDSSLIMEFLEKPWRWEPEYAAWRALGSPDPGDDNFAGFEQVID